MHATNTKHYKNPLKARDNLKIFKKKSHLFYIRRKHNTRGYKMQ